MKLGAGAYGAVYKVLIPLLYILNKCKQIVIFNMDSRGRWEKLNGAKNGSLPETRNWTKFLHLPI